MWLFCSDFSRQIAEHASALYILGDFFEAWIGDDDNSQFATQIKNLLKTFTDTGVPTYFMTGNRDFAVGELLMQQTGMTLLPDPTVIELYGQSVLLSHGDRYCTDDHRHQAWRKKLYETNLIKKLLRLPLFVPPPNRQMGKI